MNLARSKAANPLEASVTIHLRVAHRGSEGCICFEWRFFSRLPVESCIDTTAHHAWRVSVSWR